MKARYFLLFAVLSTAQMFPGPVSGQKTQDLPEKPDGRRFHVSGFGGLEFSAGKMNDKLSLMSGGKLAIIINKSVIAGIYGMGISTNHYREELKEIVNIDTPRVCFSHGGGFAGYTILNRETMQLGISIKAGGGKIFLTDPYKYYTPYDDRKGVDRVFVISPQVDISITPIYWMRINIGAGYTYTGGIDKSYRIVGEEAVRYYSDESFRTPFISLGLFFGVFNKPEQKRY